MRKTRIVFIFLVLLIVSSCQERNKKQVSIETQYKNYCGSCHLTPDPANIPKDIWKNSVLPEMAARMGYRYNNFNPEKGNTIEENYYIKLSNGYPDKALIDSLTFWKLHNYIVSLAPDSIPVDTNRRTRNKVITQFLLKPIAIPKVNIPIITNIQFDTILSQFNIGDITGGLNKWPSISSVDPERFNSPIVSYHQRNDFKYTTEIGRMRPSETPKGILIRSKQQQVDTISNELHRPVFNEIVDLNENNIDELLVCEFGHLSGRLSLFKKQGISFKRKELLPFPGAIKLEIADMNGDGKKDIVVLFSQGNEGVYIMYQKEELQFEIDQVIRMGPEYGSSWFELIDYNKDGHLDIVLVNGDNADYSVFSKPYHGLRLFINDTTNSFNEEFFYPLYGATRVLTEDFDLDGDIDFAVTSLFSDDFNLPNENFVFLENKNAGNYDFQPYTFVEPLTGSWLVMDKGDFDKDGDIDIMLGSYNVPSLKKSRVILRSKQQESPKLYLLENQNESLY